MSYLPGKKTKQQKIWEEMCGNHAEVKADDFLPCLYPAAVLGGIFLLPLAAYWLGL